MFGHSVLALKKETGHGKLMLRLAALGISYNKARPSGE
jgi:hypothetical protein